jgi:hypothetical protein
MRIVARLVFACLLVFVLALVIGALIQPSPRVNIPSSPAPSFDTAHLIARGYIEPPKDQVISFNVRRVSGAETPWVVVVYVYGFDGPVTVAKGLTTKSAANACVTRLYEQAVRDNHRVLLADRRPVGTCV